MHRVSAILAILLASVVVLTAAGLDSVALAVPPPPPAERPIAPVPPQGSQQDEDEPSLRELIGQKLLITMGGTAPSRALLGRVRRGEVGGVILLERNIRTRAALVRLTRRLQRAAAQGGQPRLLIAVDQESGNVKRVPWVPPTMSASELGRIGRTRTARLEGARTGSALRALGINVNLAPVADIPRSGASFMFQQGRTYAFDARLTARLADAFAAGLASRGVLATMKHFPGIGLATRNTDRFVDVVTASRRTLRSDLRPYRRAIRRGIPMIMLSNATYPAYDRRNAAGWSRAISVRLLRRQLGFTGVTVTDSLNGTASARGTTVRKLALRAARAGTDIILVTSSERSSRHLYGWLLKRAKDGEIRRRTLRDSYDRIVELKEGLRRRSRR